MDRALTVEVCAELAKYCDLVIDAVSYFRVKLPQLSLTQGNCLHVSVLQFILLPLLMGDNGDPSKFRLFGRCAAASDQLMNVHKCSSADMIADELIEVVEFFSQRLMLMDDMTVGERPTEERWSIAEVVGHLVDSAVNNHQRFIRAQQHGPLVFPKYEQNFWVRVQDYNSCSWENLVQLWRLMNLHLAHVVRQIPDEQMCTKCTIEPNEPVSLSFLVDDYLVHLKHHLNKINERSGI